MSATTAIGNKENRKDVKDMTQKEMSEEILLTMRAVSDALEDLSKNPMLMALMPKGIGR